MNLKLKGQNERVEKLKQRIKTCNDKIGSIEGVNKAITFYSPGEYPKAYKFDPEKNTSIFK